MSSIYTLAFYALARIGELLASNSSHFQKVIQCDDIEFRSETTELIMWVTFRDFKHNFTKQPHNIPIKQSDKAFSCPVICMKKYLEIRGNVKGPLYLTKSGNPFTRSHFDNLTKRVLAFCGFDSSKYKGHSFRIGGCSRLVSIGYTNAQIQFQGRWHSDAFKKYIRSQQLS